jgi:alpha-ribazole phosphatase
MDVGLADGFAAEAETVRRALPWEPEEIWTSPLTRCRMLAERLATGRIAMREDERLMELNFGEWEGRRWETFRGPESEAWASDPWGRRPPGGETGLELWARVASVRREVLARATERRVAVVTHAGVIRVWRALAAGGSPGGGVFDARVGYGEITPAG